MRDPVCPLKLALYGHPDSGGHWEAHCAKHLRGVGFTEIDPWRSCFWHDVLKLYLVVHVDDFKLAGPATAIKKGWELIRKGIKTDDPSPMGMYLGCRHDVSEKTLPDTGARVRCIEYNMEDFLRSCVERYKELTGLSLIHISEESVSPRLTHGDRAFGTMCSSYTLSCTSMTSSLRDLRLRSKKGGS